MTKPLLVAEPWPIPAAQLVRIRHLIEARCGLDFADSSAKNGYMRSGPSEQLSPIEIGFTCLTAFQKASIVWAEIIVSPPRPTAAEIMIGSCLPSFSNTS